MKKVSFYLAAGFFAYLGMAATTLPSGVFSQRADVPGKVADDTSSIGSDGPIVMYEDGTIMKYQITAQAKKFLPGKAEIKQGEILSCFVDETGDTFKFQLKESLIPEKSEYPLPQKMLIVSDIEGNFGGFKMILAGNKVIDENFNWTFGANHLVLVGDLFDRDLDVTQCLWLIYKLESEAEKQGGKVHFVLGNHDVMNLTGKYKYLRNKYKVNADTLNLEYRKWYSNNSELGRWLRTKNGVEKIGDYIFVHAGISKDFPKQYTISEINQQIRKSIDKDFTGSSTSNDPFIGNQSPIWYRGVAKGEEQQADIDSTLKNYKATKMIIGHTIFDQIQYLYQQKVITIDLKHKSNTKKGKMFALWHEGNKFYVTDQNAKMEELK